jgi:hypothetical protein
VAVNFNDDTWKYVYEAITEQVAKRTAECVNSTTSYEDILRAQGAVEVLKTILKLPHTHNVLAATHKRS